MSEELKPCPNPWCNSHKTTDAEIRSFEAPIVEPSRSSFEKRVSCPCCPMSGPWADTEAEAITAWNARADHTLRAENRLMREALEYYGDEHQWPNEGPWGANSTDFGARARNALAQVAK